MITLNPTRLFSEACWIKVANLNRHNWYQDGSGCFRCLTCGGSDDVVLSEVCVGIEAYVREGQAESEAL